jgi:hypothetical protein
MPDCGSAAEANANPDLRHVDGHGSRSQRGKCPALSSLAMLGVMRRASSQSSVMGSGEKPAQHLLQKFRLFPQSN